MERDKEQVISDDGEFRKEIKNYMSKYASLGTDYIMLGIIGGQSSGKSTLLNHLFMTNFQVMDVKNKRKQTTKGIWMDISEEYRMAVLDIEGADSRERWDDKAKFEKSTALFGLVISNILIVNVWVQDIGRFSGCNYEILKIIFQLNIQFFKRESAKKILFVVRDFGAMENLDYIREVLTQDIVKLWDEVQKPEEFKDLKYSDVFEVDVFTLSNFIYEKNKFLEDVVSLRKRLTDKTDQDYIFKDYDTKNIPFDAMYLYLTEIWETIKDNKDLNIPNQKIMISTFRCKEVKDDSLNKSINDFRKLRNKLKSSNSDKINLREEYDKIKLKSMNYFKGNTTYYDDTIVNNNEIDLLRGIENQFESIFKDQNDKYIEDTISELEKKMKNTINDKKENVSSALQRIIHYKKEATMNYLEFLKKFNFEEKKTDEYFKVFELSIANVVTNKLASSVNIFIKKMVRNQMNEIDNEILKTYNHLTQESWQNLNDFETESINKIKKKIQQLKDSFEEVESLFTDEIILNTEKEMVSDIKTNLKNRKNKINTYMLQKFREKFNKNPSGSNRNWRIYDDEAINKFFEIATKDFAPTFKCLDEALIFDLDNEIIFNYEETNLISTNFKKQINDILEEAFNKKYNRNSLQRVPKWFWIILAYFAYDNVLEWFRHPILFFLLIVISIGAGYIVATGKTQYVYGLYNFGKAFAMAKIFGTPEPQVSDLVKARRNYDEKESAKNIKINEVSEKKEVRKSELYE